VTIYTGDDCHWCGKAKQYLTQRGVPYIERNVEADEAAAAEAIRLSGHPGVPVIAVGERVIVGFQRGELDAVLHLGTPDAATEATLPPAQDTTAAAAAAARLAWTPEQELTAARFRQQVDAEALCGAVGQGLEYSLAACDHTFRYVGAFLSAHPPAAGDPAAILALLRSLGVECDCGYAINICTR
jgi:glutaredoxin-like YruB-family protein